MTFSVRSVEYFYTRVVDEPGYLPPAETGQNSAMPPAAAGAQAYEIHIGAYSVRARYRR
jgi:hypothetical protein